MQAIAPDVDSPPASAAQPDAAWPNRFLSLGGSFFTRLAAQPLPDPHWVATSTDCAALLGLPADWARHPDWHALQV
ncbi:MAG: hypothetical protein M3R60_05790, partial [Pseudomonadota bacterium]|nr:hypothetical protein [Pseudomonadota bacterium]